MVFGATPTLMISVRGSKKITEEPALLQTGTGYWYA